MSVNSWADIGGDTITLSVNGAKLTMTLDTAYEVCLNLSIMLKQIVEDRKLQEESAQLKKRYN